MKKIIAILALTTAMLNILNAAALEVGQPAPQLTAINQNNNSIDLGKSFSNGISLVFFYPKADTPGCTKQACSLRDSFEELMAKDVKIFGVSYDSPEKRKAFIEKYTLPFDLIADEKKNVSKAFGRGMYSRQAYLIKDGSVIWRDLKASSKKQASDVKQALTDLGLLTFASMQ